MPEATHPAPIEAPQAPPVSSPTRRQKAVALVMIALVSGLGMGALHVIHHYYLQGVSLGVQHLYIVVFGVIVSVLAGWLVLQRFWALQAQQADEALALTHTSEALARSENTLRALFKYAPVCIHEIDALGAISAMNPAGLEIMGMDCEEDVVGMPYLDAVAVEDKARIEGLLHKAFDGQASEFVFRAEGSERPRYFTSSFVPLPTEGGAPRLMGITQDITKRLEAEQALLRSEELNRRILEALPGGIVQVSLQGAIQYANDEAQRILGLSYDDLTARFVADFEAVTFWEDGSPCPVEEYPVTRCLMTGRAQPPAVIGVQRPDASITWAIFTAVPFFEPDTNNLEGAVVTFLDITQRKKAEEKVRSLNQALEQRIWDRTAELEVVNRELEAFSYSVSHDLRAPLRAISGFAEILERRYKANLDDEARHFLDNIVSASRQMDQLIKDMLTYARLGQTALNEHPVDLRPMVEDLCQLMAARLEEAHAKVEITDHLPLVVGDSTLLRQVLTNLLDNALLYRCPDRPLRVRIDGEPYGDLVRVSVSDNGIGISSDHHEVIFRMFQRLQDPEVYPGTGIGLAIVKRSIERMGGEVGVESDLDVGSTFYFTLPATSAAA